MRRNGQASSAAGVILRWGVLLCGTSGDSGDFSELLGNTPYGIVDLIGLPLPGVLDSTMSAWDIRRRKNCWNISTQHFCMITAVAE